MSKNAPIEQDDRWYTGEEKLIKFDIVDADDAPLDVSGFALRWVLERIVPGGLRTDVLSKTSGDGITVENGSGTNDRVVVAIGAADTESIDAEVYHHALWRTDSGNEALLAEGSAMLSESAVGDTA